MQEIQWERDEMITLSRLREILEQVEIVGPILEEDGYGEFPNTYTLSNQNIEHILNLLREEK